MIGSHLIREEHVERQREQTDARDHAAGARAQTLQEPGGPVRVNARVLLT